jgi:hypothetical protein
MDHTVLRRLDRIDTIVIDTDVLTTGALVIGDVVPVAGGDPAELAAVVNELFAPDLPTEIRAEGLFVLGPLDKLRLRGRPAPGPRPS